MPRIAISVVICTYNPRLDYLSRTLAALQNQTLGAQEWELIIVDNNSDDPIASCVDVSWHASARVVREETQGLTPARLCGIREARGDLIVFVDDDNVLDTDYLEQALGVAKGRPFLGAWSGQCRPTFESPPAEWTRRYWGNLVIREFSTDAWSNLPFLSTTMPCGAGLCVRRAVAQEYHRLHDTGARGFQIDRTGRSLLSGGDNDLAACACDIGLGVGLIKSLRLSHLIPPDRLTEDYLGRLAEGIYLSSVVLAHMRRAQNELLAYRVRWHEPLRVLLSRGPHRSIQLAAIRGRRKGLRLVSASR